MNYTDAFTFRKNNKHKNTTAVQDISDTSDSSDSIGVSTNNAHKPDPADDVKDDQEILENGIVFTNTGGKVVTKVSYNEGWAQNNVNAIKSNFNSNQNANIQTGNAVRKDQKPLNRRVFLAGGGYGQTPPKVNIRLPSANIRGIGFDQAHPQNNGYAGNGGYGGSGGYGGGGGFGGSGGHGVAGGYGGSGGYSGSGGFGGHGGSGYGSTGYSQPSYGYIGGHGGGAQSFSLSFPFNEIQICPDIILAAIVAAAAVAAGGLYLAITAAGRRKRNVSTDSASEVFDRLLAALHIGRRWVALEGDGW